MTSMVMKNYKLTLILLLYVTGWNAYPADIAKYSDDKVKASLLYNIGKMVSWPAHSFKTGEPILILFLGKDNNELGSYFDAKVRSRALTIHGRKLAVKLVDRSKLDRVVRKELKQCHILFVFSTYNGSLSKLLHAIGNRPVLVIGESSSFSNDGGMIGLYVEKERICISVNLDATAKKDFLISAQLLQHAIIVRTVHE